MKVFSNPIFTQRFAILWVLLWAAPAIQQARADVLKVFQVEASATNTSAQALTIDNPFTNNKPGARLILTQYWAGIYNPHSVGVFYNATIAKWQIVNEDMVALPMGARFNVRVAAATATQTFEFIGTGLNSNSDFSVMNRAGLNAKPNALLLATHYINPNRLFSTYLPVPVGVFYNTVDGVNKWAVYNEDQSTANATAYLVANITNEKHVSSQTSDPATIGGDTFYISDPTADGNPNAIIFVTHNFGASENYQDHPVGVYYTGDRWAIFNEDVQTFAVNETFNIEVFAGPTPTP